MLAQLIMSVVVEPLDGGLFQGPVHAFDLTVGPRMVWLCQSMIDVGFGTDQIDADTSERFTFLQHDLDFGDGPTFPLGISELHTIVGQHHVDFVGHCLNQSLQEICRHASCGSFMELYEDALRCSIDSDKQMQLALCSPDFGDVYMEGADGISLELLLRWLVALNGWQARDAMAQ